MSKNVVRPQPPVTEYQATPDIAVANTIERMTKINNPVVEVLGNLENDSDVQRLSTMLNIGKDEEFGLDFVKDYAYTELALTNSLRTKMGGIRSEQLVRITKQPDVMTNQNEGIIGRIRNKFGR